MGVGYVRQSAADIVDGVVVEASPLNAEFNQLQGAFNSSTGHTHDGTLGEGPKISLTGAITGILPLANGGLDGVHNNIATTDPTTANDGGQGYVPGSIWVNTTSKTWFVCTSISPGNAQWNTYQPLNPALTSVGGLATTADKMIYTTASNLYATTSLTPFARTFIDDANGPAVLTTLGISTFAQTILDDLDAATVRGTIGLGSISTQGSGAVNITGGTLTGVSVNGTITTGAANITGGTITGITDLAIADGGTGSSSVAAMKTSFALDNVNNTTDMNKPLSTAQQTYIDNRTAQFSPTGMIAAFVSGVPTGWVEGNGALLSRTSYAVLWSQVSATAVTESQWNSSGLYGRFSVGDGSTTFRLPDFRGFFLRHLDGGRGVDPSRVLGLGQAGQNLSHNHAASSDGQGNHVHGVNDPSHAHAVIGSGGTTTNNSFVKIDGNSNNVNGTTAGAFTGISIQAAGVHSHNISVGVDGGSEARPINLSVVYAIKYI